MHQIVFASDDDLIGNGQTYFQYLIYLYLIFFTLSTPNTWLSIICWNNEWKNHYRNNYFKAWKWGSILVHQIIPFFNACYKHKNRHYNRAVWKGCHHCIQGDNNKNVGLTFQAYQTEDLEGRGLIKHEENKHKKWTQ